MNKAYKKQLKNSVLTLVISACLFLLGSKWLGQYKTHGYYVDNRDLATIHGEQGLFTIYALLALSFIFLVYGIYQILSLEKDQPEDTKPTNDL